MLGTPHAAKAASEDSNGTQQPPGGGQVAQTAPQGGDSLGDVTHWLTDGGPITYQGLTLYGTVDLGAAYQSHGTPLSSHFGPGMEYLVQKNSNNSVTSLAPNGLSQSKIGIKGEHDLGDGFTGIFKLEAGFQPTSGDLTDGPKSMALNNGRALTDQGSNGDSSRAGQIFNSEAYLGVDSEKWGRLTFGRQNGVLLDDILAYDPQGGSYAFSVIGYSGAAAGGGNTEDARLNDALKYWNKFGPVRVAAMARFGGLGGTAVSAEQFDVGSDWAGLHGDLVVSHVKDSVAAAILSTPSDYLKGTISDNTAVAGMLKYAIGPLSAFTGYEHIQYNNPSNTVGVGTRTIGGYILDPTSNTTFTNGKRLGITWAGLKYRAMENLDITGAYYHLAQNDYSGTSCSDSSKGTCSGSLNSVSLVADYRFTKRIDGYGGVMYSHALDGMANGYLHTNTVSPMIGARYNF